MRSQRRNTELPSAVWRHSATLPKMAQLINYVLVHFYVSPIPYHVVVNTGIQPTKPKDR